MKWKNAVYCWLHVSAHISWSLNNKINRDAVRCCSNLNFHVVTPLWTVTVITAMSLTSKTRIWATMLLGLRRTSPMPPPFRSPSFRVVTIHMISESQCRSLPSSFPFPSTSTRHSLQSPDTFTCVMPLIRTQLCNRSFAVAGPNIRNKLPTELCI